MSQLKLTRRAFAAVSGSAFLPLLTPGAARAQGTDRRTPADASGLVRGARDQSDVACRGEDDGVTAVVVDSAGPCGRLSGVIVASRALYQIVS